MVADPRHRVAERANWYGNGDREADLEKTIILHKKTISDKKIIPMEKRVSRHENWKMLQKI